MGLSLASNERKTRIGFDPRNTAWANDTSRFGHQYMLRQGWKPGRGLGSSVEGRTTHVKVKSRPDGKGLGGSDGPDMPTGLDDFQRLLGRLNGTEEKVENQLSERKRKQVGLYLNFVPGGVLEGTIERFTAKRARDLNESKENLSKPKKSKISKKSNIEEKEKTKAEKKVKRSKKKEEKKSKKEEGRERKKEKAKDSEEPKKQSGGEVRQKKADKGGDESRGIQATRRRYIAMKRRATADPQSLKEILMR